MFIAVFAGSVKVCSVTPSRYPGSSFLGIYHGTAGAIIAR